tara:strand:- start:24 stop:134 length:111 start_codon:yes stop_codon:yes gene_type:complete
MNALLGFIAIVMGIGVIALWLSGAGSNRDNNDDYAE